MVINVHVLYIIIGEYYTIFQYRRIGTMDVKSENAEGCGKVKSKDFRSWVTGDLNN